MPSTRLLTTYLRRPPSQSPWTPPAASPIESWQTLGHSPDSPLARGRSGKLPTSPRAVRGNRRLLEARTFFPLPRLLGSERDGVRRARRERPSPRKVPGASRPSGSGRGHSLPPRRDRDGGGRDCGRDGVGVAFRGPDAGAGALGAAAERDHACRPGLGGGRRRHRGDQGVLPPWLARQLLFLRALCRSRHPRRPGWLQSLHRFGGLDRARTLFPQAHQGTILPLRLYGRFCCLPRGDRLGTTAGAADGGQGREEDRPHRPQHGRPQLDAHLRRLPQPLLPRCPGGVPRPHRRPLRQPHAAPRRLRQAAARDPLPRRLAEAPVRVGGGGGGGPGDKGHRAADGRGEQAARREGAGDGGDAKGDHVELEERRQAHAEAAVPVERGGRHPLHGGNHSTRPHRHWPRLSLLLDHGRRPRLHQADRGPPQARRRLRDRQSQGQPPPAPGAGVQGRGGAGDPRVHHEVIGPGGGGSRENRLSQHTDVQEIAMFVLHCIRAIILLGRNPYRARLLPDSGRHELARCSAGDGAGDRPLFLELHEKDFVEDRSLKRAKERRANRKGTRIGGDRP